MKQIKLNLGCGSDKRNGYINIDANQKVKPDLVCDLTQCLPYPDNCVSKIVLQDILEHLTKEDGQKLISECGRILMKNGKITIRVPNISAILKKFKGQDDLIMLYFYGDTSQGSTFGGHKYGYTPLLLKEACQKAGITINQIKKAETNFLIYGRKEKMPLKQIVCDNLFSFIFLTPYSFFQRKEITWKIYKKYHPLLGKLILRPLSRKVSCVICTKKTETFVKDILKYSHLRTVIEDI